MELLFGGHKNKPIKEYNNQINKNEEPQAQSTNLRKRTEYDFPRNGYEEELYEPISYPKNQYNVNNSHATTCKKIIKHENKSMSVELSDGSIINIPKPGEHAQRSLTQQDKVRATLIRLYIEKLTDQEIPDSKKAKGLNPKINPIKHEGPIIILDTTSQDLIDEITSKQKNTVIGVHNFTNRKQLGGGALNGRMAQEESLVYYFPEVLVSYLKLEGNRGRDFFLERGEVMVTKTEKNGSEIVVSASALPWIYSQNQQKVTLNNNDIGANEKESLSLDKYIQIIDNAMLNLIKSACDNGVEVLITGAWGSGVYNNDPKLVAKRFKKILNSPDTTGKLWKENFKSIIFAIPGENSKNHIAYKNTFGENKS